jgi:outer membrane protein TolC
MTSRFLTAALLLSTPALAQEPPTIAQRVATDADAPSTVTLTIEEAVSMGLQRSFRVQRSNRNETMAEHRADTARAGRRPRFDMGVSAGQNQTYFDFRGNAQTFNRADPQFSADANATASLPLDISGVTKRQVRQADLTHKISELDVRQASIDVAADIRVNFVNALRAQEQVRAEAEYVAQIQELLSRARPQQPGVVPFLETELSNAQQTLQSTRTSSEIAFQTLRQNLRLPRTTALELKSTLPIPGQVPGIDTLLDVATRNRIDLQQAAIRLEQARIATIQASDSRRPRLAVTAYANQRLNDELPTFQNFDGRTRSGGVVVTGTLPLISIDGGVVRNGRRIAGVQAEQALADREEGIERAENEINQVMISLTRAKQRMQSLPDVQQALAALNRVEDLMLSAPASDAPGYVAQVTNARQNWRSAVVSRNDSLTDFYSNFFRLQKAVGTDDLPAH